jgi:hypothetical protein
MEHLVTYLRVLDADAEGAEWTEVARIVLHPTREPARARRALGEPPCPGEVDDRARIQTSPRRRQDP